MRWVTHHQDLSPGAESPPELLSSEKFDTQALTAAGWCLASEGYSRVWPDRHPMALVQRPGPALNLGQEPCMGQAHYAGFTGGETEAQAGDTACRGVTTQLQEQKQTSSSPRPVLSYHPISDGTTSRQQPPALALPFCLRFCPVLVTRLGPPSSQAQEFARFGPISSQPCSRTGGTG